MPFKQIQRDIYPFKQTTMRYIQRYTPFKQTTMRYICKDRDIYKDIKQTTMRYIHRLTRYIQRYTPLNRLQ